MEATYKTTVEDYVNWYDKTPRTKYHFKLIDSSKNACCDEMKCQLTEGFVGIQESNSLPPEDVPPEIRLHWKAPAYDGYSDEGMYIEFCPWCGQQIVVKEVQRVRRVSSEIQVTETRTVTQHEDIEEEIPKLRFPNYTE